MNEKLAEKAKELERADAEVRKIKNDIESMFCSMIEPHLNESTKYYCNVDFISLGDATSCISIDWFVDDDDISLKRLKAIEQEIGEADIIIKTGYNDTLKKPLLKVTILARVPPQF